MAGSPEKIQFHYTPSRLLESITVFKKWHTGYIVNTHVECSTEPMYRYTSRQYHGQVDCGNKSTGTGHVLNCD
jgi:hypothetical protein